MRVGSDSCFKCSQKRASLLGDTALLRDAIIDRHDKLDGKTYGLAIGMLFDGEIERCEISVIKKSHVKIIGCPLKIIETRSAIDKNSGRIETPSVANYNLNNVDIASTFRLLELCRARPFAFPSHCFFLTKSSKGRKLIFSEKLSCVDTRLPKSVASTARHANAIFKENVSAHTLLFYV